jgi:hypothetical protein
LTAQAAKYATPSRIRRGLTGGEPADLTRYSPGRTQHGFLYREQRLFVDALDDSTSRSRTRICRQLIGTGLPADGAVQGHFHALGTRHSDGPVEVGVAFAGTVEPSGRSSNPARPARSQGQSPARRATRRRSEVWNVPPSPAATEAQGFVHQVVVVGVESYRFVELRGSVDIGHRLHR